MLWFCGGHGSCTTDAGDTTAIERDTLNWLNRYLKGDKRVGTGPRFEWLDQRGYAYSADDYPLKASAPLVGTGSGNLPLVNGGGSGPAIDPNGDPLGVLGATVAATRATTAVNVAIPPPPSAEVVLGAPKVTLAYSGTATDPDARVFAQIVDEEYGGVLGNQITPIPLTLDGQTHTVTRSLEVISATSPGGGAGYTLQLTPSSTAYGPARSAGLANFHDIRVELPTSSVPPVAEYGAPDPPEGKSTDEQRKTACASRRVVQVNVKRKYIKRLRSGQVYVGKKWAAKITRLRTWAFVSFSGKKPGTQRVKLVLRLRDGRRVVDVRHYKTCVPKRRV